jgi:hypothetical protein
MEKVKQDHLGKLVPMANVGRMCIHEGNKTVLVRESGVAEELKQHEQRVSIEVAVEDIAKMKADTLIQSMTAAADQMALRNTKLFIEEVRRATEEVGNVVDAHGQPVSKELLLQMLEKLAIDFDQNGNPELPAIVAGTKICEALVRLGGELDNDADWERRFGEIIARKKEEWRARESDRKLVG